MPSDGKEGAENRVIRQQGLWTGVPFTRQDQESANEVARKTRMLLPLTPDAIRKHLTGKQTIGIYPLLPDETCWFLAVDFDKKSWMADAAAFLEHVVSSKCQQLLRDLDPETARMFGCSLIELYSPPMPEGLDAAY